MRIHWLWLATRPGLSDRKKMAILKAFPDPEDVYLADEKELFVISGLTEEERESLLDKDLKEAEKILETCGEKDIEICVFSDENYPYRLKNIDDPPLVLYYRGQFPDFEKAPAIGTVGTRSASVYGLTAAKQLGFQIARCGAILVSGIAKGIDAATMEGALKAGGTVVGILGNGADVVYPTCNRFLFADTRRHGCLISEFPPGTPPMKWNFPKRNRIISGLCNGVLVVEAPAGSGALITAKHALEQGRDVFSVPGSITSPTSAGTNALLQEGARAVLSGWDVMKEYAHQYPEKISRRDTVLQAERPMEKVAQKPQTPKSVAKKSIDKLEKSTYSGAHTAGTALTEPEKALVACVAAEGSLMDEIIAQSGMNAAEAKKMLTKLALKKVLVLHPGGRVTLKQ